ncbi:hypothetical protein APHAL10511_007471 [Amanita phalloides]|nr:hypothetical protein APHAL10511_007471 [Amanita phalloides]
MTSLSACRLAHRHSSSSSSSTSSSMSSTTTNNNHNHNHNHNTNTTTTGNLPMSTTPLHVHPHPYRLQPTLIPLSFSSLPQSLASLGIPSPGPNGWSPQADQEYDDIMYKLDLGAESPYLRAAYAELSFPPSRHAGGGGGGVPEMIVEVDEAEEGEEEIEPARNYADVDCRMCLKKAVSRTRTRCCNTVFCRMHIDEWLKREESKGLCPMCDKPCVLAQAPPPPPLLSVSTCRSSISSMSSSTSTTSTLVEEGLWETEAEDMWDVKGAWKKNDGGSLDVKGMVRDVVGELLQFMGLVWVGHRKESSGVMTQLASVVGLVLVLFVLLW